MERRISAQAAQQLKETQIKMEALQMEYQVTHLSQQNIILSAALELGMTKEELDNSLLNPDAEGFVFVPKPEEKAELKAVEAA